MAFIENFQAEPILWDVKHRSYKDKSLNHDAWNRIQEKMNIPVPELKKRKNLFSQATENIEKWLEILIHRVPVKMRCTNQYGLRMMHSTHS